MAYAMYSAMLGDRVCLEYVKHTARDVRSEVAKLFPEGGWRAAKKAGWRIVSVWVGLDSRYAARR